VKLLGQPQHRALGGNFVIWLITFSVSIPTWAPAWERMALALLAVAWAEGRPAAGRG
jgi:hypothetical protein